MTIEVVAKCSDCCTVRCPDLALEKQGYVPRDLGIGGGDYIRLTIDTNTGKIEGWLPLTGEDLKDALNQKR